MNIKIFFRCTCFLPGRDKDLSAPLYVINLGCLIPYLFLSRLTPPLAAIILLQVSLIEYLGSGPSWDKTNYVLTEMCKDNWWLALLYVQNYFSGHRMVRRLWMKYVMYGTVILNQHYLYVMAVWILCF
jgi:hypothetical protein